MLKTYRRLQNNYANNVYRLRRVFYCFIIKIKFWKKSCEILKMKKNKFDKTKKFHEFIVVLILMIKTMQFLIAVIENLMSLYCFVVRTSTLRLI